MFSRHLFSATVRTTAFLLFAVTIPSSAHERTALTFQQKEAPEKELTYKVPQGWREVEVTAFLKARYQVSNGEQTATFTIATLAAPGGGLIANVNRWRAQIGLEALAEAALLRSLKETKIDTLSGHVADLTGPKKEDQPAQRTLGAIVTRGEQAWFFKLTGPADLVGREKTGFEELLKSVRFAKP